MCNAYCSRVYSKIGTKCKGGPLTDEDRQFYNNYKMFYMELYEQLILFGHIRRCDASKALVTKWPTSNFGICRSESESQQRSRRNASRRGRAREGNPGDDGQNLWRRSMGRSELGVERSFFQMLKRDLATL